MKSKECTKYEFGTGNNSKVFLEQTWTVEKFQIFTKSHLEDFILRITITCMQFFNIVVVHDPLT
jgi:hypothetical protein